MFRAPTPNPEAEAKARERTTSRLVKQLEKLGHAVTLQTTATASAGQSAT
jgi:hypothetical protein